MYGAVEVTRKPFEVYLDQGESSYIVIKKKNESETLKCTVLKNVKNIVRLYTTLVIISEPDDG